MLCGRALIIDKPLSNTVAPRLTRLEEAICLVLSSDDESESEDAEPEHTPLTAAKVAEVLRKAQDLVDFVNENDPSEERSQNIYDAITRAVFPYKEIQKEMYAKQRQSSLTDFFTKE